MKKVLIYYNEKKLAPKGGPAGYLYNLKKGFELIEASDVQFEFYNKEKGKIEGNQKLRNIVPNRIKEIRRAYKFANYLNREVEYDESMLDYESIHFHQTEDLYLNRKLLENYKGVVILTSHTPCVPYKEIIGRLNPKDYKLFKKKIDRLVEIDKYAFQRADIVIFPCKDAEDPYFNTWPEYQKIRDSRKLKYIPTGIVGCLPKVDKNTIRQKFNISNDAFVISYVGRHNEIKGYAELKKIGEEVLKNKNVYFLIAGKEGPLYKLENSRWIEVGWTNDPHSLISASDMFILPNKETYFDLVLLEVLSLGTPVLLSKTGGNKYFEKFNCQEIQFYETIEQAVSFINKKAQSNDYKCTMEKRQVVKKIFHDNFTVEVFANKYLKVIEEILE